MTRDLNSWDDASSSVLRRIIENSYRSLQSLTITVISGGLQVLTECFQCGKLNNLKYLCFVSAGITPNIIWAWLESANSLKVLKIYDSEISEHDQNELHHYIHEKNFDLKLMFKIFLTLSTDVQLWTCCNFKQDFVAHEMTLYDRYFG
ncbi:unnamed protein product [Clavelina lepadiformis]|uniref:Uncharacterized protein n=1 Tax=Clavelina lepadiformis TaxID=159417 RepID=A0ABP0GJQ5_CLALP